MDILAHMLWTNYGAGVANKRLKEGGRKPVKTIWAMFWGVFPDLFAFGLPITAALILSFGTGNFNWKILFNHRLASGFMLLDLPAFLYQFSHSLIIFILVFALVRVISKKFQLAMLGWAFHICLDIFSHSADFYPTPIFFPISAWHFIYGIRWSNPYFMLVNYSLIILVGIYFYRKEKNTQKLFTK